MSWPLLIIIGSQLLFTLSDLMGRVNMKAGGFTVANFMTLWFAGYMLIRLVATVGQLYIFASIDLGKSMALFGAASIVLSNMLGFLVLKEVLSPTVYLAISLVVLAFMILAWR